MKLYLCIAVLVFTGCTDGVLGKFKSYGSGAKVRCWSGGMIIYDGQSTGKVSSEANSDGYYFVEKSSGQTLEISADCITKYNK